MNPREIRSSKNACLGQNSTSANSSAEINRLSSELNSRISREMDEMMNSVSVQIQRANNDAISSHVLPQIQNAIMAGSGHMTQKGCNVPAEGPETNTEVLRKEKVRNSSKGEFTQNRHNDELIGNAYDRSPFVCFDCFDFLPLNGCQKIPKGLFYFFRHCDTLKISLNFFRNFFRFPKGPPSIIFIFFIEPAFHKAQRVSPFLQI